MGTNVKSLQDYKYYIELYDEEDIIVSSTSNNSGVLAFDDNGNTLSSYIHTGSNYIYEATLSGVGDIILYDDVGFSFIDQSFTEDDKRYRFLIKPTHQINYKINATLTNTSDITSGKININLTSKGIFKVFINGREVKTYISDSTGITPTGIYASYIQCVSDTATVYTYALSQTVSGTITFKYKSVNTYVPFLNDVETYLDTNGNQICNFESINVSTNETNNRINNLYQYTNFDEKVSRASTLSFNFFQDRSNTVVDLRTYLINKRFRVVAFSELNNEMVVYSNCIWNTGESITIQRYKNLYSMTFDFEDELVVTYTSNATAYGAGFYGAAEYGGVGFYVNNIRIEV